MLDTDKLKLLLGLVGLCLSIESSASAIYSSSSSNAMQYSNYGNYSRALERTKEDKLCEHNGALFGIHKSRGKLEVEMKGRELVYVVNSDRQNLYLSAFRNVDCENIEFN